MHRWLSIALLWSSCGEYVDYAAKEDGCVHTGGTLTSESCCVGTPDYANVCIDPDLCPCTDSPDNEVVLSCDCGPSNCYDGTNCIRPDPDTSMALP